jgi:hypothetical protein
MQHESYKCMTVIYQLFAYIIRRDSYDYVTYMSSLSIHYTAGQLQI